MLPFAQSYPDFSYDPDSGVGPMGNGGDGGHLFTSERDVRRQRRGRHLTKGRSMAVFPFGCDESAAFLHQALFWIGSPTTLFYVDGTFIFFLLIFIHFCTRHGLI